MSTTFMVVEFLGGNEERVFGSLAVGYIFDVYFDRVRRIYVDLLGIQTFKI